MMDLHCHVDLYPDFSEVLNDIQSCNFYVLSVTTVPSAFEGTEGLTKHLKNCKTALGLHPQLAHQRKNELVLFDQLIERTRYIGEIGLDGSKGFKEHFADQLMVFSHILKSCESYSDKILTIHSLNAVDEVLTCLKAYPKAGTSILHWFLGSKSQVDAAVDMGCYFSIGPAMLDSARGRKVVSWMPLNRILLETDGPFAKLNGKALLPSDTNLAVQYLSTINGVDCTDIKNSIKSNLRRIVSSKD
ncbi:Qat anti-phage system TatD family nuclease QatD [Rheinheimera sp. NSM]|uniref:Qat anti-phage system TatD family nuclease QatD n=1 Tax=Rheinheimera sp. NSM TaxID=3457884 RepID=UPI0040358247